MTTEGLQDAFEKVEEISAALVLADFSNLSDLTALAGIDTLFEKLYGSTEEADIREIAKACRQTVEDMIFKVCKIDDGVKVLSDKLTSLRRMIKYGAQGDDGSASDISAATDDSGAAINIDLDDDEDDKKKAPSAPPVEQDSEGFFVDTNENVKAAAHANFAKVVDLATLDSTLLGDFIAESQEHLLNANDALLRLEAAPADVDIINELFRVFHTIKGVAGFLSLSAIQALTHSTESLMDKAREKAFVLSPEAVDLVFTVVDALKKEVDTLNSALMDSLPYQVQDGMDQLIVTVDSMLEALKSGRSTTEKLGETLIKEGKVTEDDVSKALYEQERRPGAKIGEILVEQGAVSPADVKSVVEKQVAAGGKGPVVVKESVKVDTEKLDRLIDMIGELVITEAMVTGDEAIKNIRSPRLGSNMRQLDKITRQLQEIGLSLRMMSLKTQFQKMARLVRDLAKKTGKEINFVSIGEDTELDKSVIEHIADPLVHMVRNSADHGIEPPEDRIKAGKTREGTLTLRAYQKGGSICIEIEDDGRGLNREAILKKAMDKGLIDNPSSLTENEINHMIFHPGFSTAAQVTDVSGRGVGMDVVRKNVEALRGRIEIRTKVGEGSVFTIHLPLTLAIMDGLVVKAGGERYIIPTLSVVENFRPTAKDLTEVMGLQKMVMCHGELLPLYSIAEVMGKKNTVAIEDGIVMVVEDAGKRTGLLVDKIVGQQQTVIKKLGEGVGKIRGVSGGAIMPDGQVSLIIDVAETVKLSAESGSTIKRPEGALV